MGQAASSEPAYPGARAAAHRRSTDPDTVAVVSNAHHQAPRTRVQRTHNGFHNAAAYQPPGARIGTSVRNGSNTPAPAPAPTTRFVPGAFGVTPTAAGTPGRLLRVIVPAGARPGATFEVLSDGRRFRVRCPGNVRPGQPLDVTVPAAPRERFYGASAPLARHGGEEGGDRQGCQALTESERDTIGGKVSDGSVVEEENKKKDDGEKLDEVQEEEQEEEEDDDDVPPAPSPPPTRLPDTPGIRRMPNQNNAWLVPVPLGVSAGQNFRITIDGQRLQIACPPNVRSGMFVKVVPPPRPAPAVGTEEEDSQQQQQQQRPSPPPRPRMTMQPYEVNVPQGIRPGQNFHLMAGGQRVMVTCPRNAGPGRRIRFELPVRVNDGDAAPSNDDNHNSNNNNNDNTIKLSYETKDGWTRTVRLSDYRFHWIMTDSKGNDDSNDNFNLRTSAFCRKIRFEEGDDPRMRTGVVNLVPAGEASSDSTVLNVKGERIVRYEDIAAAQSKPFSDKVAWFHDACRKLRVPWDKGHVKLKVRRPHLLGDSLQAVMSMGRVDLRKTWRFEFHGEDGVDAGGLAREWFELVTKDVFNADRGLWSSNAGNQMCNQINAAAELTCGPDYRDHYRFLGRVMGKALFDGQLVSGHLVRHLYKHLLGWPVTFDDLEMIDEQYHANMEKMAAYTAEELEAMCLDFTYTEQHLGTLEVVELVPGGKERDVTVDNLAEYLELCTKYRLLGRIRPHLTELLLGFHDVVPEPLTTVFDFQELELLMCGLPEVDMEDWKENTVYSGSASADREVVRWFWDVVENVFDEATRAKLLQFATGTSGVPSRGFSVLQGNDGDVRKFCINGVGTDVSVYPRSHTCFNRIDLPMYKTKKELRDKLKVALEYESIGFSIE